MVEGSPALWLGASRFKIPDVVDDGVELVVSVKATATIVGLLVARDAGHSQGSAVGQQLVLAIGNFKRTLAGDHGRRVSATSGVALRALAPGEP